MNCIFYWEDVSYYLSNVVCLDMGALQLDVGLGHMRDASMVIGQAEVDNLTELARDKPLCKFVHLDPRSLISC